VASVNAGRRSHGSADTYDGAATALPAGSVPAGAGDGPDPRAPHARL